MDDVDNSAQPTSTEASARVALGLDLPDDQWIERVRSVRRPGPLSRLGPYEVLAEVSRGAQGIVYRARQPNTNRLIALKRLLSGSLATEAMRARFEREMEVEVELQHPNIVRVYGMDFIDGQPVLAMEWIEGVPLDQWAVGRHRPAGPFRVTEQIPASAPLRSRLGSDTEIADCLAMFLKICDAVHHAHQRGVIHRDLKPSNILVDADGEPHVLDFGLAKLLRADGSSAGQLTHTQDFVGTPAYAAPEQVRGEHHNVDVTTDAYALGVILYQMLAGRLPYRSTENLAALLDAIRDAEPDRPSSVNRSLDSELDAILLKALSKRKEQRYQSLDAFAADLRRYLAGDPVEAKRSSFGYLFRKFARRHRVGLTATAGLAAMLIGAVVVSTTMYLQTEQARQETADERDKAVAAERRSTKALKFLKDVIAYANPYEAKNPNLTMREALDRASEKVKPELGDEPEVAAEMHRSIGMAYSYLGESDLAQAHWREVVPLAERIVEDCRRNLGIDHPDTLRAMTQLGADYVMLGLHEEALPVHEQALDGFRRVMGDDHPETLKAMYWVAGEYGGAGRYTESLQLFEETLESQERVLGDDHDDTLFTMQQLSVVYRDLLRFEEAVVLGEKLLERRRRSLGQENPRTMMAMLLLADSYCRLDRYDQAAPLEEEILAVRRRLLGDDHMETLSAACGLAWTNSKLGRTDETRDLIAELFDVWRRKVERLDTPATDLDKFASQLLNVEPPELRDPPLALRLAERACALAEQTGDIWLPWYLNTFAWAQHRSGDSQRAVQTMERALSLVREDMTWAVPNLERALAELEAELVGEANGSEDQETAGSDEESLSDEATDE